MYEDLKKLIDTINPSEQIELSDIPAIDLYMDQVTTLFDSKLKTFRRDDEDKLLTKTMINNYAKAKLLMPVKDKKYSKEQMVILAIIYNLKQSLSINDISKVLTPILNKLNSKEDSFSLYDFYSNFLDLNKLQNEEFNLWFRDKINFTKENYHNMSEDEGIHIILIVLMLINSSNIQKRMAEKIIDNFLTPKK
jgi:hypothetical protein